MYHQRPSGTFLSHPHSDSLDPSPYTRHTFWSTLVLGFYYMVNMVGFHQASYQRFASLGSLKVSKR